MNCYVGFFVCSIFFNGSVSSIAGMSPVGCFQEQPTKAQLAEMPAVHWPGPVQ